MSLGDLLGGAMFVEVIVSRPGLYGARIPLSVAFPVGIIALALGLVLGVLAGYLGGRIDRLLVVVMDSMQAFPAVILALTLRAVVHRGRAVAGCGPSAPAPSWGVMLNEGFERVRESPWPLAVPALALVIATPGFNLLGETLHDIDLDVTPGQVHRVVGESGSTPLGTPTPSSCSPPPRSSRRRGGRAEGCLDSFPAPTPRPGRRPCTQHTPPAAVWRGIRPVGCLLGPHMVSPGSAADCSTQETSCASSSSSSSWMSQ